VKKYRITSYQPHDANLWNAFTGNSRNGSFLFDRGFMDYHSDRFSDYSLIVKDNEKVVAILPANKLDDLVISHQGLTYGGLVYNNLNLEEIIVIFSLILQYLYERSISTLRIKLIPYIYHRIPCQEMDYVLFLAGATLLRRDSLAVCEPAKHPAFSSLRKRGIKKASNNGLTIIEEKEFEGFWSQILIPNLQQRHQVQPVHTLDEIRMLAGRFPNNIRQFNVYDGERIVAGTTIFENDTVAHAQYISTYGGEKTGALDFLFAYLITEVFAAKPYFDFGISNEENGMKLNAGLSNWKQGFGAGTVVHDFYELPTKNHSRLQAIFIKHDDSIFRPKEIKPAIREAISVETCGSVG
jgi:hypothetical protein